MGEGLAPGLEGKVALVTGGARGQGANYCRFLASEGVNIVAVDICRDIEPFYTLATQDDLNQTVEDCESRGVQAVGAIADVRFIDEVRAAVDRGLEKFGHIDILVNNAGVTKVSAIDETPQNLLDGIIDINLKGAFNATQCVVPGMKERKYGKIVNISSAAAVRPLPYISHYSAAKGAIIAVTKSWAKELGPWNINVNCLAPGTIYTGMIIGMAADLGKDPDEAYAEFNEGNLFDGERGLISMDDTARALLYLVGDNSRMTTGQIVSVDGGKTN